MNASAFTCGFIKDAVSSSYYVVPDDSIINELEIEGSGRGLISGTIPAFAWRD
jgi:hypothetical protein